MAGGRLVGSSCLMLLGGGGEGQPPNDEGKAASWRDGRRQRRRMSMVLKFGETKDKSFGKIKTRNSNQI